MTQNFGFIYEIFLNTVKRVKHPLNGLNLTHLSKFVELQVIDRVHYCAKIPWDYLKLSGTSSNFP